MYRYIQGLDGNCASVMSSQEIQQELHDPFWTGVLSTGAWPGTLPDLSTAILKAFQSQLWQVTSFLVGEGSQVPVTIAPRDGNRDLRYALALGPPSATPQIFVSARPPQVQGGITNTALEVLAFDPVKKLYNYYQFVNNGQDYYPPPSTWTWSGDSHHAWQGASAANGCFKCHINGALNMKELTLPWNNWNASAPGQLVNPNNVPAALASDPLFKKLENAATLENIFQGAHTQIFGMQLQLSIQGNTVSNVPQLLKRLITTTTINFGSSQNLSTSTASLALPKDFFIYDSMLRDPSINLSYNFPSSLNINGKAYAQYLQDRQFRLVNCNDGTPQYTVPGATFFAGFVPLPAYEDSDAIRQMISSKVISPQFAASILMVDFPNPVFSRVRTGLLAYANQIQTAALSPSPNDAPTQFANLVRKVAKPCPSPARLPQCGAEEQFLYYYQATWRTSAQAQVNAYLQAVQKRISTSGTGPGVADYLSLTVSRGVQFANWNPICNLDEKELLLPCTSLGQTWSQMKPDGTIASQTSYACTVPPPNPCSCGALHQHKR